MTNEEKQLVIKDLCSRLPYGVWFRYNDENGKIAEERLYRIDIDDEELNGEYPLKYCKPFLRKETDMTDEEKRKFQRTTLKHRGVLTYSLHTYNYLRSIHVDIEGLIPKGLAIHAEKEVYNL